MTSVAAEYNQLDWAMPFPEIEQALTGYCVFVAREPPQPSPYFRPCPQLADVLLVPLTVGAG